MGFVASNPPIASAASFTAIDLGKFPGGGDSEALGINGDGEIVGAAFTARGQRHAFSYTRSGGMSDLGTLPGGSFTEATAVSDRGEIVGYGDQRHRR